MKKISIIVPTYNSSRTIKKTLKSIFTQTYKNYEVIVVDAFSTDNTKRIISNLNSKKIKVYNISKKKSLSYARYYGIKKSTGSLIAFLDSDDVWHPLKLKKQLEFMEKNNFMFTSTTYSPFRLINGKKVFKEKIVPNQCYQLDNFILDTTIATSSMIINKDITRQIYFNKKYFNEDYNYKCKLLLNHQKAYNLNENLMYYRITKKSKSSYKLKSLFSIFKSNKDLLKMNLFNNLKSIFFIILRSIKKYGLK